MTEQELPGEDELNQSGYVLIVEDMDMDPSRIFNVVDFDLLIDVTEVEGFRSRVSNILELEGFGDRVYLCNDPKVVWDSGMGGMMLFRSTNLEGQTKSFMIFDGKRSAPVQKLVEEVFRIPPKESDA